MATLVASINALKAEHGAKKFNAAVDSMNNKVKKTGKTMGGFKKILLGTFASAIILKGMKAYLSVLSEQERVNAQLVAGLKSTKGASGQTFESIKRVSSEMQRLTRFSNEAVEEVAAIGLSFTKISGDIFPQFLRISADVATRMGTDLKNTSIQLAKALNDPIANLGALGRAGIQFSKDQKATIKAFVETNQIAKAQSIILKELEDQYGGSAAAARDTMAGAMDGLKNAFADLAKELSGGSFGVALKDSVELLTDALIKAKEITAFFKRSSVKVSGNARIGGGFGGGPQIGGSIGGGGIEGEKPKEMVEQTVSALEEYRRLMVSLNPMTNKFVADTQERSKAMELIAQNASSFGRTIASSFEEAIFSGQKLGDVLRSLANDLSRLLFRSLVTQPLADAITAGISGNSSGFSGAELTRIYNDPNTPTSNAPDFSPKRGGGDTYVFNSLDPRTAVDYVSQVNQQISEKYPRQ